MIQGQAVFTFPYSYSQIHPTFRTACSNLTTARTDLGCEVFTHFLKQYPCVLAFISEAHEIINEGERISIVDFFELEYAKQP